MAMFVSSFHASDYLHHVLISKSDNQKSEPPPEGHAFRVAPRRAPVVFNALPLCTDQAAAPGHGPASIYQADNAGNFNFGSIAAHDAFWWSKVAFERMLLASPGFKS